jgi:hypothetical protein
MSKQLPKWFKGLAFDSGKSVTNPYSGESRELDAVEFTVYARIMNLQRDIDRSGGVFNPQTAPMQKEMSQCLGWFRNNNAEAYMALLD